VELIGLVGLGLMGSALAERLRAAGREVAGYDNRVEARDGLARAGGNPVGSVREVFARTRIVILSLPDSEVVAGVVREAGDLAVGSTIIDTTTGDPAASERLGRELADRGADFLDATITGSSAEARRGEVIVTAGGLKSVFLAAEPLLVLFSRRSFFVGPWGSGARIKLIVNLVLGLNRAVLAEGLAFARRCGMDAAKVLEILQSSAAYSKVMDAKGRKMIESDFDPQARLSQHLKDVRLVLEEGARSGASLPLSRVHEVLLTRLVEQGLGDCDNSAIIRAFEREGGAT
jgi:3-hydroxyisobutyrate dehydrogenase-like beta-hydroxyacid dehydrogenase